MEPIKIIASISMGFLITAALLIIIWVINKTKRKPNNHKILITVGKNISANEYGAKKTGSLLDQEEDYLDTSVILQPSGGMWTVKLTDLQNNYVYSSLVYDELVIGRCKNQTSSNYLELKDVLSISKTHCRIFAYNGKLYVVDCGSRNHTFLNDRIVNGPARLEDGDRLQLGAVAFQLTIKKNDLL